MTLEFFTFHLPWMRIYSSTKFVNKYLLLSLIHLFMFYCEGLIVLFSVLIENFIFSVSVFSESVFSESVFSKSVFPESVISERVFSDFVFSESVFSKSVFAES